MHISSATTAKRKEVSLVNSVKHGEAFEAQVLRLADENCTTQATAQQLGISFKLRLAASVGGGWSGQ